MQIKYDLDKVPKKSRDVTFLLKKVLKILKSNIYLLKCYSIELFYAILLSSCFAFAF